MHLHSGNAHFCERTPWKNKALVQKIRLFAKYNLGQNPWDKTHILVRFFGLVAVAAPLPPRTMLFQSRNHAWDSCYPGNNIEKGEGGGGHMSEKCAWICEMCWIKNRRFCARSLKSFCPRLYFRHFVIYDVHVSNIVTSMYSFKERYLFDDF